VSGLQDCKIRRGKAARRIITAVVELPANEFFIGEIVDAFCGEEFLTEGVPDTAKIRPFTLTMPDNRYWEMGRSTAKAWSIGKRIK